MDWVLATSLAITFGWGYAALRLWEFFSGGKSDNRQWRALCGFFAALAIAAVVTVINDVLDLLGIAPAHYCYVVRMIIVRLIFGLALLNLFWQMVVSKR